MITDQEYQDLQYLIASNGWQVVCEYIKKQMSQLVYDLENKDFNNMAEVSLFQGKLRAYRTILDYSRTRIEEYQRKAG